MEQKPPDPRSADGQRVDEPRAPNARIDAHVAAPLVTMPRFETPTPRSRDEPIIETPSAKASHAADRRAGTQVVLATMVVSVIVSTALEYQGWQIGFRTAGAPTGLSGIPLGGFTRGVVDTFSGALGVGAAAAIAATLLPASWRRPWRSIAAGFAFGAAGFLLAIAYVTSLAS